MHLDRDGRLTVYPVGVDRVPRDWRFRPDGEPDEPWFQPADGPIEPRLIEEPFALG